MVRAALNIQAIAARTGFIIRRPRDFYMQMPLVGGYTEPLVFCLLMGVVSGLVATAFSLFSTGHIGSMSFGLLSIAVVPVAALTGCYIFSAIMLAIWKLMGSRQDFEVAFRCVAYSFALLPVAIAIAFIPYAGTLVATLWWFWLMFICSTDIHKLERRKSLLVILAIAALILLMNLSGEKSRRQLDSRHNEFNQKMDELQNKQLETE